MALALSTLSAEVALGSAYWPTLVASVTGLVPAGNGAVCSVPAPVVSLTALSQYQRIPSGEPRQLFTPLATVARLASLPSVWIFRTSGPDPTARDDQAMVSEPGTGKPTWKCGRSGLSAALSEMTCSMRASG